MTLDEGPDAQRLERIAQMLTASLQPVRPLPSNGVLAGGFLLLFGATARLAPVPVGLYGYHALNAEQRIVIFSLIAACAIAMSWSVVAHLIPGSKPAPPAIVPALIFALAGADLLLFPNFDTTRFIPHGIPCLRFGLLCATATAALAYPILRRGLFTAPIAAGATTGCFAGLAGFAALALHCPILIAPHILVWHFGAVLFATLGGGLASFFIPKVFLAD